MRRVDGQRCEDREDPVLELRIHMSAVVVIERGVVRESKTDLAETFHDRLERAHLAGGEIDGPALNL